MIEGLPKLSPRWSTTELIITMCVGVVIGITIALLFSIGCSETVITDHEVLIGNFLGHEELMVVKKQ
jgi:hypothetical protein